MSEAQGEPISDARMAELHTLVDHGVDMRALEWSLEPTLTDMEAGLQQLLAEVERLRAREAALTAVARAVGEIEPICESGYGELNCMYCDGDQYQRDAQGKIIYKGDPAYDPRKYFNHNVNCPVLKARALLTTEEA